jgi:hypothetical protein
LASITNPSSNLEISGFLIETFYSDTGDLVEDSSNLNISVAFT